MGHKASMNSLHPIWSLVAWWATWLTVLRQVFLRHPGCLLPSGFHLEAYLGIQSSSILSTCPSHFKSIYVFGMLWLLVFLYICFLDILVGQKVWQILLRHLLWKTSSLLMSLLTARQPSDPWRRTDFAVVQEHLCFKAVLFRSPDGTELGKGTLNLSQPCSYVFLNCPALTNEADTVGEVFHKHKWWDSQMWVLWGWSLGTSLEFWKSWCQVWPVSFLIACWSGLLKGGQDGLWLVLLFCDPVY